MKKYILPILIICLILVICGCSGKGKSDSDSYDKASLLDTCGSFEVSEVGTANVAPLGYAMAGSSKHDDGFSNLYANDGEYSTGFSTEWDSLDKDSGTYIFVDLKEVYNLSELKIYPMTGYETLFPENFEILVSEDGDNYTSVQSFEGIDGTAVSSGFSVDLSGLKARFIRLNASLLNITAKTGYAMVLSEIEVYAQVDSLHNLILNRDSMWMYLNPSSTQQLEKKYRLIDNGGGKISYVSQDESVATVTKDGFVTAVGLGETYIYAYDGANLNKCKVKVLDDSSDFRISVFYHSSFGHPDIVRSSFDSLKAAGIDYIEETRSYDHVGNDISLYHVFLCSERDIFYSPCDVLGDDNVLTMTDDEIVSLVKKYENMAGFGGLYLQDEPHEEYTQYAHVCRVITEYNPHVTPHLNLLPPYNFEGSEEYFTNFLATAGGDYRYRYLSYDHYPFGTASGSFNSQIYESINMLRKAGLKYNAPTGFYMQAMGIRNAYRVPNQYETNYIASIGIAYGIKNFKWFVGLTPITSGEDYITGIIGPDYTTGELYECVKNTNSIIRSAMAVLDDSDAIEVYHKAKTAGNDTVPEDFALKASSKNPFIITLYEKQDGIKQEFIVVTNTNFSAKKGKDFTFVLKDGIDSLEIYQNGEFSPVSLSGDRSFDIHIDCGGFVILKLPEGYDASKAEESSDNLALGCAAFVSTSDAGFWSKNGISADYLTDGSSVAGYWATTEGDSSPYVLIDLEECKNVSKIHFTKTQSAAFPSSFTVSVSEDGDSYAEIGTYKEKDSCNISFDSVKCRYIMIKLKSSGVCGLSEIEVY